MHGIKLDAARRPWVDADDNDLVESRSGLLKDVVRRALPNVFVNDAFKVVQAGSTANNFKIKAGTGFIGGYAVNLPADVDYVNNGDSLAKKNIMSKLDAVVDAGASTTVDDDTRLWSTIPGTLAGRTIRGDVIGASSDITISSVISDTRLGLAANSGAAAADFYRINLSTPGGARSDVVILDVFLDRVDSVEDTDLKHNPGSIEARTRVKVRTVIEVLEGVTPGNILPVEETTDGRGLPHVRIKLATLSRTAVAAIVTADITDDRQVLGAGGQTVSYADTLDIYADAGGDDANDGLTSATAKGTLKGVFEMLKLVPFGDVNVNIRAGTYDEDPIAITGVGVVGGGASTSAEGRIINIKQFDSGSIIIRPANNAGTITDLFSIVGCRVSIDDNITFNSNSKTGWSSLLRLENSTVLMPSNNLLLTTADGVTTALKVERNSYLEAGVINTGGSTTGVSVDRSQLKVNSLSISSGTGTTNVGLKLAFGAMVAVVGSVATSIDGIMASAVSVDGTSSLIMNPAGSVTLGLDSTTTESVLRTVEVIGTSSVNLSPTGVLTINDVKGGSGVYVDERSSFIAKVQGANNVVIAHVGGTGSPTAVEVRGGSFVNIDTSGSISFSGGFDFGVRAFSLSEVRLTSFTLVLDGILNTAFSIWYESKVFVFVGGSLSFDAGGTLIYADQKTRVTLYGSGAPDATISMIGSLVTSGTVIRATNQSDVTIYDFKSITHTTAGINTGSQFIWASDTSRVKMTLSDTTAPLSTEFPNLIRCYEGSYVEVFTHIWDNTLFAGTSANSVGVDCQNGSEVYFSKTLCKLDNTPDHVIKIDGGSKVSFAQDAYILANSDGVNNNWTKGVTVEGNSVFDGTRGKVIFNLLAIDNTAPDVERGVAVTGNSRFLLGDRTRGSSYQGVLRVALNSFTNTGGTDTNGAMVFVMDGSVLNIWSNSSGVSNAFVGPLFTEVIGAQSFFYANYGSSIKVDGLKEIGYKENAANAPATHSTRNTANNGSEILLWASTAADNLTYEPSPSGSRVEKTWFLAGRQSRILFFGMRTSQTITNANGVLTTPFAHALEQSQIFLQANPDLYWNSGATSAASPVFKSQQGSSIHYDNNESTVETFNTIHGSIVENGSQVTAADREIYGYDGGGITIIDNVGMPDDGKREGALRMLDSSVGTGGKVEMELYNGTSWIIVWNEVNLPLTS